MRRLSIVLIADVLALVAWGCNSAPEAAPSKPLTAEQMQEKGISEGAAPGVGGKQDPGSGQSSAPPASANSAQGDL